MTAPAAFISYSHDSQEHKYWVLELGMRLRSNGVDALLDQWDLGPGGDLPHFMEQSIAKADRTVMICTERYVEKANRGAGGVGYEKMILTADLIRQIDSKRVIPVIRQTGSHHLPTFMSTKFYIDLSSADQFETGFDQLLRELLGVPLFQKPMLGVAPTLLPMNAPRPSLPDPVTRFITALAEVYEQSTAGGAIDSDRVRRAMDVSKLLFDHAVDLAEQQELIHTSSAKSHFFVQPSGRALMLTIAAGKSSAA